MLNIASRYFRENADFLIIAGLWLVTGIVLRPAVLVVLPLLLFLLYRRKKYIELFLGFFLMLILSDSRNPSLWFATDAKNVYIVCLAGFILLGGNDFRPISNLTKRFAVFIFFTLLFVFFSPNISQTFQKTLSYILILFVVPNYLLNAIRTDRELALKRIVEFGLFILLLGFLLRFLAPGLVSLEGRYIGMLGNPNGLGLFCLLFMMVFNAIRDLCPDLFSKKQFYIITGIILFSAVLCQSRNAIFSITLFLFFRQLSRVSPVLVIFIFLVLVTGYQLISNNLGFIITQFGLEEYFRIETLESGSGRLIAWKFGWDKISENPFAGGGIGFTDWYYRINYDYLSILGHQGNAHNSYITFWLDTGILGLVAYLVAFISGFIKGAARVISSFPAMYAILFSAFFESWLTASLNPFTIQALIVLTLVSSDEIAAILRPSQPEEQTEISEDNPE